jgi:hypothetical protein
MNVYIGGLVCSTPFGLTPISLTPEVRNAHPRYAPLARQHSLLHVAGWQLPAN